MTPIIEEETQEEIRHPHVEVPTLRRFLWGMGGFADTNINSNSSLVNAIYVNARHFNPALVNLACAIPRFLDFVTDPLIGHLSDNTRSRYGRRRPWIFAGLILSAAISVLIWHPPYANDAGNWLTFSFLAVMMSLLFSFGYAFFAIPHTAMGYEMSTDYNERTHLFKWRCYASSMGGFASPWFLPLCMWIEGPRAQTLKGSHGIVYVSLIIAGLILLSGLPTVFFCREKLVEHLAGKKIQFIDAVKLTLSNRPFWLLVISNFITKFGMSVTGIFFLYVFVYHIAKGDQPAGAAYLAVFFTAINITNVLAMAPVAALTERIGKKPALLLMLAMSAVAYVSLWFTFTNSQRSFLHLHTWGSHMLNMQWPSFITAILIGVFTNTMPMIKNSMLADVCDHDQLTSGHRREAFYSAVFITTDKIAMAISLACQGLLLYASGFNSKLDVQSPGTIRFWLLALVITQPVGYVIGIISIFLYPLSRSRVHEIRAQLDRMSTSTDSGAA